MKKLFFIITILAIFTVSDTLAQTSADDLKYAKALELGYRSIDNEKYDEALTEFNLAIELNPKIFMGYAGRAEVYLRKGDHEKEIYDINKVIELNPTMLSAYAQRAYAYYMIGDIDKSILDYTKVIEQSSDNKLIAQSYNYRALIYYAKKEYAQALEDLRKALKARKEEKTTVREVYEFCGFE